MRTGKIVATAINISSQPLITYDLGFLGAGCGKFYIIDPVAFGSCLSFGICRELHSWTLLHEECCIDSLCFRAHASEIDVFEGLLPSTEC